MEVIASEYYPTSIRYNGYGLIYLMIIFSFLKRCNSKKALRKNRNQADFKSDINNKNFTSICICGKISCKAIIYLFEM
jgi:hypothetical protein